MERHYFQVKQLFKRGKRLLDLLRFYGRVYVDQLKFCQSIPSEEGGNLQEREYADVNYGIRDVFRTQLSINDRAF